MPVADAPRNHYYEVLGVSTDASEETIRAAYKRLALQWHPDRHQDNKEEAQKMFVEIHESYLALSEYVKRQQRHKDRGSGKDIPHPVPPWGSEAPSSTPSECGTDRPSSPHSERRSKTIKPRKDRDSKADEHKFPPSIHASHSSGSSSKSSHSRAGTERSETQVPHSKFDLDYSSDEEEDPTKKPHQKYGHLGDDDYEFVDLVDLGSPLQPLRIPKSRSDTSKDWIFPLPLNLEDLYRSSSLHYRITRTLRSGKRQSVKIDIQISPSWRNGSRIRLPGIGNQRKDGSYQDIVFVVKEIPHPRFTRKGSDLYVNVQVPWADSPTAPYRSSSDSRSHEHHPPLRAEEVYVKALNGEEYALPIPRSLVEGADGTRIVGAGMPIRRHGQSVGKGDLFVKWEFVFPDIGEVQQSRWQTLRKAIHLKI